MIRPNPSDVDRERYEQMLLTKIPKGQSLGNKTLIRTLQWGEDLYYVIRDGLIDKGILETVQGGGVRVIKELEPDIKDAETRVEEAEYHLERELYPGIESVLRGEWAKHNRYDDGFFFVEVTANRRSGRFGKWSYPDLMFVGYRSYTYVPGRFLDVYSFEVKHYNGLNIDALYETLAHLRAVHKSYLVVYIPESIPKDKYSLVFDKLNIVIEEAQRFGLGVIVAPDITNMEKWEFKVEAVRREPDPEKLDALLASDLLSPQNKETVRKWAN